MLTAAPSEDTRVMNVYSHGLTCLLLDWNGGGVRYRRDALNVHLKTFTDLKNTLMLNVSLFDDT